MKGELDMSKAEILKELIILMEFANHDVRPLGIRNETSMDNRVRSKDIRAFLVDLFDGYADGEEGILLHILEEKINENISFCKSEEGEED